MSLHERCVTEETDLDKAPKLYLSEAYDEMGLDKYDPCPFSMWLRKVMTFIDAERLDTLKKIIARSYQLEKEEME